MVSTIKCARASSSPSSSLRAWSRQYYNTILQGYRENGLDKSYLQTALENSLQIEHMVNDEFDEEYCAEDYDGYYDIDDFQMKF